MKKYFIFAAAALVSLAACSKVNTIDVASVEDDAIGFSAYTGTAVTKGNSYAVTDVYATDKGIGVFAFYQPSNGGVKTDFNTKKFATPDFMYNQQVKPNAVTAAVLYQTLAEYNDAKDPDITQAEFDALPDSKKVKTPASVDKWVYTPIKYWPNNVNDQVSFFAYAPYNPNKTWEDMAFKTDVNATKLTTSFPVYNEKTSMVDYLFAKPALNKTKQSVDTIAGGKSKDIINFEFKHIMSRVAINLGVVIDSLNTNAHAPMAWTDNNTEITIQSIEIKGIAESYDYSYSIGATTDPESWSVSGSQDIKLTKDDFQNDTIKVGKYDAAGYKTLLANENSKPGYLFIAPQDLSAKEMVVTYTVKTTDPNNNPANNSTITNEVTKKLIKFESGKAYTLNLLIGMKTVELSATVTDWDEILPPTQIDIPANI